jgi:adenylylsulfate reductase subunit B
MVLNKEIEKAYNRDVAMCWECYNCVKICPVQAIEMRGYADFVPLGATVTPMRGSDAIMWTVKFRNGTLKRFKFPIRTTPEGTAVPDGGWKTGTENLGDPTLFSEPGSLGMDAVATLK